MKENTPDIILRTQDFWEPRLGYRPTEGEAEEMVRNVSALFRLLMEWEAKDACLPGEESTKGRDFE